MTGISAPNDNSPRLSEAQAKARISEAISLHRKGEMDQAEIIYSQVLETFPKHANALQLLGILKGAQGNVGAATELMQKSLSINPDQPHVRLNLARTYLRQQQFEKSLAEYETLAEAAPENVDAFFGMGVVNEKLNRPEAAIHAYGQALHLKPDHVLSLINLAVLHLNRKEKVQARDLFEKALTFQPHNVSALNGLGSCLQQEGKVAESVQYFKTAIGHDPHSAEAYTNLSFAQYELRQYEASVENCRKAISLSPESAIAYNNYSITLHALGDIQQSEAMARKAIQYNPNYANAWNNLGNALQAQGLKKEAFEAYRKATEINPGYAQAYRNMSLVNRFREEHRPIIDHMEALNRHPQAGDNERMHLGFALGKAYEDLKMPDQSFSHYAQGNRLARKTLPYHTNAARAFFDEIKQVYSEDFARVMPVSDIEDDTPIFILGMPRSGTTLTEQILASHPDVFGAEELSYLGQIATQGAERWFSQPYPRFVPDAVPEQLQKIGHAYLEKLRTHSTTAKHITDKMPANFQYIGLILQSMPNARIIHCKRNPMDNCFSIFKYYFVGKIAYAYDLKDLGEFYLLYQDLMDHWNALFKDRIFEVDYERMTEEPDVLIPKLVEFCGLPWDDACLNFHTTRRDVRTASAMQVRQPIYKTSVEAWRAYETHLEPLKKALKLD